MCGDHVFGAWKEESEYERRSGEGVGDIDSRAVANNIAD